MAIDYTRPRPTPPASSPAPSAPVSPSVPSPQAAPTGGPSWYTPPEVAEAAGSAAGSPNLAPPPAPAAPPAPAVVPAPSVSLRKVSLTAASPQVSLTKSGGNTGTIGINLNWSAGAPAATGGGFFKRLTTPAAAGVDLDLGCLYELADGSKGVVQALGNSFGALDRPPWIKLDGDDRTGSVTTGENMSINLDQPSRFRRVLIFAMIYEGAPNWAAVDGVVTLSPINGPQIEVRLDATSKAARICAVAQLINQGNELVVQREVRYIDGGQSVLDRTYGWGLNWTPGRK